jgi:DNA-binding IclR family transcriptional regulator
MQRTIEDLIAAREMSRPPRRAGGRDGNRMTVRSVERAVAVLEFLAHSERPALLHEISGAIRAPKSTALNIVRTLAGTRALNVDPLTKAYSLGPLLGELSGHARQHAEVRALARPYLERLSRDTGEGAFLSVLEGDEIVYIDKVESTQAIRYAAPVGGRRPLHCTSAGKVALALSSPRFVDRYVRRGLTEYTPSTMTDAAGLRSQLARVGRRGYAEARSEYVPGLMGIAAPVLGASGALAGVVTVAGPAFRMRSHQREIREALMRATKQLSLDYVRSAAS